MFINRSPYSELVPQIRPGNENGEGATVTSRTD